MIDQTKQLPLISVLIPTFNVEEFVEEAILSIVNQTYRNLEIIIVDDCSTDETYNILLRLAQDDNRIKLFRNSNNLKIVETLNFAISKAEGDYFARMDGDDVSLPTRIADQLEFLNQNPDIDLIGLNVIMIDEEGEIIHNERYLELHDDIVKASKYVSPIPHFWLAKRQVYTMLNGYRIATVEDYDFILRAIDKNLKLHNLNSFLYKQRIRRGNTATASGLIQYKLRNYVKDLAQERRNKGGVDNFSNDVLNQKRKVTAVESFFYRISSKLHHRYIVTKQRNKLLAISYMSLAILFSPIRQLDQIVARNKYKGLKK